MIYPKGYYVYGHRDFYTKNWIYIGKGVDNRAFNLKDRSKKHKEYIENSEIEIIIFIDKLNEYQALSLESLAIKKLLTVHGYGADISGYRFIGRKEGKFLFNKIIGHIDEKILELEIGRNWNIEDINRPKGILNTIKIGKVEGAKKIEPKAIEEVTEIVKIKNSHFEDYNIFSLSTF